MQTDEFVSRYVEMWNKPSRAEITELFADDAVHAIEIGMWRGTEQIESRITEAYGEFVQPGEYHFKPAGDAVRHNDAIRFTATMVRIATGEVEWTGTVFLVFDADGRIKYDYQFTNQDAATRVVVNELLRRTADGDQARELFSGEACGAVPEDVHTVLFDRTDAVVLGAKSALRLTVEENLITGWQLYRG